LGSNPGRRGGKPVNNCLSYGTAIDDGMVKNELERIWEENLMA
jgi:hypothetical protein